MSLLGKAYSARFGPGGGCEFIIGYTPLFLIFSFAALQTSPKKDIAIVKNIPENNARLWKIKHLIKITPINFPFGEPSANDINYTQLRPNGECVVIKELQVDEQRIEDSKAFKENPKRLDGVTLTRDTRLRWVNPWQT